MKTKMQAAIVLSGCLAAALPTLVQAQDRSQAGTSGYQMAAITDRAYGEEILAGDYATAIDRLAGRGARFESSTNLCVAYTLSGDLESADRACADALAASERRVRGDARPADRRDLAIALSNRGVVSAMRGDLMGAVASFSRAVKLGGDAGQAENNLSRSTRAITEVMREVGAEA